MDEELSEYEKLRQRNILENLQKMKELGIISQDYEEKERHERQTRRSFQSESNENKQRRRSKQIIQIKRTIRTRQSGRFSLTQAAEFTPDVSKIILGELNTCLVTRDEYCSEHNVVIDYSSSDEEDIENRQRRRTRRHIESSTSPRKILSVDEVTEDMLQNIAQFSTGKTYSQDGTTCHQCRQKTLDQKSTCRSTECYGVRGQFCGPCLKNRYGELVEDALMNSDWVCPVCRGICNCSICRNQNGKAPTGALAPFAFSRGFKSVKHLLEKEEDGL